MDNYTSTYVCLPGAITGCLWRRFCGQRGRALASIGRVTACTTVNPLCSQPPPKAAPLSCLPPCSGWRQPWCCTSTTAQGARRHLCMSACCEIVTVLPQHCVALASLSEAKRSLRLLQQFSTLFERLAKASLQKLSTAVYARATALAALVSIGGKIIYVVCLPLLAAAGSCAS